MEDTHWEDLKKTYKECSDVLILVLMEDTHWESAGAYGKSLWWRLNPCFNGRYSLSKNYESKLEGVS